MSAHTPDDLSALIREFAALSASAEHARIVSWLERESRPSDWQDEFWTCGPEVAAFLGQDGLKSLHDIQQRAMTLPSSPLTHCAGRLRHRADRAIERGRRR